MVARRGNQDGVGYFDFVPEMAYKYKLRVNRQPRAGSTESVVVDLPEVTPEHNLMLSLSQELGVFSHSDLALEY